MASGSRRREGTSAWKAASSASRVAWMPQRHPVPGGRWAKPTHGQAAIMASPAGQAAGRTTEASRASGPDSSIRQTRQPLTGAR